MSLATHALAMTLSGDMVTPLKVVVGPPSYDPVNHVLALPQMLGADLSNHETMVLSGLLSHESAERGMSTWSPDDPRWKDRPALRTLVNALNDVRINRLQAKEYPGSGIAFDYIEQTCWDVVALAPRQSPVLELAHSIMHLAAGRSIDDCIRARPSTWDAFDVVRPILDVERMTATEEACIEGALQLYARFPEEPDDPQLGKPVTGATGKQGPKPSNDPQDFGAKALALLTRSLKSRGMRSDKGPVLEYTWDPSQDQVTMLSASNLPRLGIEQVQQDGAILGLALQRVLVTPFPVVTRHLDRGRLDRRKLAQVPMGVRSVMQRRVRREVSKTALGLSLDISKSVEDHMHTIRHAAGTLAFAASQAQMPLDITAWSGMYASFADHIYRQVALDLKIVAPFETPPLEAYDRLLGLESVLFTPTAEGVQFSAHRLSRRREPRKVLFVVTDGMPSIASRGDREVHLGYLRTVLSRCARAGIEVVTLGVVDQTKALKDLFPRWIHVEDFDDLGRQLSDALMETLRPAL